MITHKTSPTRIFSSASFSMKCEITRDLWNEEWPWAVTVDIDGRPSTTYGMDPLDAVENGSRHAAIVLHGVHGDTLEPPLEPRI
jgi:hypothetical protein